MFLRFYHSSQPRLAVYGLGLTQIAQISAGFPFVGGKSHGCSAPLLPKAHTDSTRFNKIIICEKFVLIRGSKTSHEFVLICG